MYFLPKTTFAFLFCSLLLLSLPLIPLLLPGAAFPQSSSLLGNDSDKPISIDADQLEVMHDKKIAVFEGDVVAKQGSMTLKSDKMTVYYSKTGDSANSARSKNSIKKIEVHGNVLLYSPTETAKSQEGTYEIGKKLVKLHGNVTLNKGNNVLKGASLIYNIETGKSTLSNTSGTSGSDAIGNGRSSKGGRVKGLFIPEKQTEQSE